MTKGVGPIVFKKLDLNEVEHLTDLNLWVVHDLKVDDKYL